MSRFEIGEPGCEWIRSWHELNGGDLAQRNGYWIGNLGLPGAVIGDAIRTMMGFEPTGNAQAIIAGDPIATFMGGLTRTVALAGIPGIGARSAINSASGSMLAEAGKAIADARLLLARSDLALVSGFLSAGASATAQFMSTHGKIDWADAWMAGDVGSITGGFASVLARAPVAGSLVDAIGTRLGASTVGSFASVTQYAYTERAHGRDLQASKLVFNAGTGAITGWFIGSVTFPNVGNHNYYYYFWNLNFQAFSTARTYITSTIIDLPLDDYLHQTYTWSRSVFNINQGITKP